MMINSNDTNKTENNADMKGAKDNSLNKTNRIFMLLPIVAIAYVVFALADDILIRTTSIPYWSVSETYAEVVFSSLCTVAVLGSAIQSIVIGSFSSKIYGLTLKELLAGPQKRINIIKTLVVSFISIAIGLVLLALDFCTTITAVAICILLIIAYVLVNSYCMQNYGYTSLISFIINTLLSFVLIWIMIVLKRIEYYGLRKINNIKEYLYFVPLFLIASVNLWNGFNLNKSTSEIIFHILTMINVGFIEEIIFRGFLFKMMVKDNVKSAIIVSSLTFGIGHIVNLLNGADLIPTLIQICYAVSLGYLFVTIFYKSKSLIPCIVTHIVINATSIFNIENTISLYIAPIVLIIVPLIYSCYINKKVKE